jgi:uncharacterized protein
MTEISLTQSEVAFPSCGEILRGWLLAPARASAPLPGIVMAPGMSGVKEGALLRYGRVFAEAGFCVLGYDNINFGASGGTPRQEADALLQRRGYRDAITYMTLREDVDRSRIGIWGTSMSGSHVLEVAAQDRRVKCVVAQVFGVDGFESSLRRRSLAQRRELQARYDADREARFRGEPPAMLPAVSADPGEPCAMPGPEAYAHFMAEAAHAPAWQNVLTLRSAELSSLVVTTGFLTRISPTPLLMIVALEDEHNPADLAIKAYHQALEPKKLLLLGGGHFTPYREHFDVTSTAAADWFTHHLLAKDPYALSAEVAG